MRHVERMAGCAVFERRQNAILTRCGNGAHGGCRIGQRP